MAPTSSLTSLPPIAALPIQPTTTITNLLDLLFEPSPDLHTLALPVVTQNTFPDYTSLITTLQNHLVALLPSPQLDSILSSHPRLGARKVDSAQSAAEQAQLQQGSADEAERLRQLNDEYEAKFPGLRYVVFVNGRGREEIMRDMRARIQDSNGEAERKTAVQAMCEIAADRAKKLSAAEES